MTYQLTDPYPCGDLTPSLAAEGLLALALFPNFSKGKVAEPLGVCSGPDLASK